MADRELKVIISGDPSSLQRAFKDSSKGASRLGSGLKTLGKVAAVGVGAAFAGLAATLKVGFEEIAEGQKVMAQTQAVLKSTGGVANVTAKQVEGLAQSLSKMSGVDDELIQSSENLLLTFKNVRNEVGKGNDVFNQATEAALDLSVAGFGSIESTAKMMGKALNDPIKGMTALGRAGVTFTAEQAKTIKALVQSNDLLGAQKIILQEVQSQVGGSAKAYGETLPGQLSKLRNSFEELAARIATAVLPALTSVVGFLNEQMPVIERTVDSAMQTIGSVLEGLAPIAKQAFDGIKGAAEDFLGTVRQLAPTLQSLGQTVVGLSFSSFGQSAVVATVAMVAMHGTITRLVTAFQALRTAAAGAGIASLIGPAGLLTAAMGLLAFAFYNIVTSSDAAASAYDRQKAALDNLNNAADESVQATQRLRDAKVNARQADLNLKTAVDQLAAARKDDATTARQLEQLEINVAQAKNNSKRATTELRDATENATEKTKNNATAIRGLREEAKQATTEMGKTAKSLQETGNQAGKHAVVKSYATQMLAVAREAKQVADRTKESNPLISTAATNFSKVATQAANYAKRTGEIPKNLKAAVSGARTAGAEVGDSFGQGIAAGIGRQSPVIAAAAATAVRNAKAAADAAARAKSPSELFAELGRNISEGMRKGIVEKYAALKDAGKKAVDALISGVVTAVQNQKSVVSGAISTLVSAALSAFDALHDGVKTAAEKALEAFDLTQAKNEAAKRIQELKDALTAAAGELQKFQVEGPEFVVQKEGESPEDFAERQVAAQEAYNEKLKQLTDQRNAAQLALDEELEAQRLAKQRAALERRAQESRAKEDDQTALERYQFERRLGNLTRALETGRITQKEFLKRLRNLYEEFEIPMQNRGKALGLAVAAGLNDAEKAVTTAVEKLVDLIQKGFEKVEVTIDVQVRGQKQEGKHRAMGGPVKRGDPYIVGERGPELFVPRSAGKIIPNGGGGAAMAGTTMVFNFPNYVGDQRDLERTMQTIMRRFENSNGVSFTGRAL